MKILLFKGSGFIAKLIKWQSRSKYSHAAVLDGDTVYEAREFKGVRKIKLADIAGQNFDAFTVNMSENQRHDVLDFLDAQMGKKYDYSSVARFVSRRQASRSASGKWFCSELVYAAFSEAGIDLLREGSIEPWAVSPSLLSLSPKMVLNFNPVEHEQTK